MRSSLNSLVLSLLATVLFGGAALAQGPGVCQIPQDFQSQCAQQPYPGQAIYGAPAYGGCDTGGEACGPCWTVTADGVVFQRSTTRSQDIFAPAPSVAALPSVNSQSALDFPMEVGPQFSVIRHGPCGWDLEVAYFQVDGWAATAFVPGTSVMQTGGNGTGFLVDNASARYASAIYMGEINVRRQWLDCLTLLAGFRMGEYNERYSADGTGSQIPVPISFRENTFNHLYGFQLGADAQAYSNGVLRINTWCKAGIYDNFASANSRQIQAGISDDSVAGTREQMAFMGEAGVVLTYQITCHLAARFVYEAAWLEGIALAPEQIPNNNFVAGVTTLDTHGGVFFHGGGMGLELKF